MARIFVIATTLVIFSPVSGSESNRILFLGDSLTAGYGLDPGEAYPAQLERMLRDDGFEVRVMNAGVSGDTSAGGLRRLKWVLRKPVDILVVALGANDALRGQPPGSTRENLEEIIDRAREQYPEIEILLAGMKAPPNMGGDYGESFNRIYPELAKEKDVVLMPFLLSEVAAEKAFNQEDGIHPTAEGQRIIAENMKPHLKELLK